MTLRNLKLLAYAETYSAYYPPSSAQMWYVLDAFRRPERSPKAGYFSRAEPAGEGVFVDSSYTAPCGVQ